MKILITGGAGFIGSNFARFIDEKVASAKITIIDDFSNARIENLARLRETSYANV